jgi:hypothetical protein
MCGHLDGSSKAIFVMNCLDPPMGAHGEVDLRGRLKLGIENLNAFRANAVSEAKVSVFPQVAFDLFPVVLVIPNLLAVGAYGQNAPQGDDFGDVLKDQEDVKCGFKSERSGGYKYVNRLNSVVFTYSQFGLFTHHTIALHGQRYRIPDQTVFAMGCFTTAFGRIAMMEAVQYFTAWPLEDWSRIVLQQLNGGEVRIQDARLTVHYENG